jgi:hypothetical protein
VEEKGFCEVYEAENTVEREGREKRVGWELRMAVFFSILTRFSSFSCHKIHLYL